MEKTYLAHGSTLLGSSAALVSAAAWAFGSILFRRLGDKVPPLGMNLAKGIIGILYLGTIILLFGWKPMDSRSFILLGTSGLVGIAFGDTFFFRALMYLGPRLTILLNMLGPVFTVLLAVFFLKEKPLVMGWMGMFLVCAGVTWVLWESTPQAKIKENRRAGIKYALLSALCMSVGIILVKAGVASISALQATLIRFLWAVLGLIVWGLKRGQIKNWLAPFKDISLVKFTFFSVSVIIFGGFWLSVVALKYSDASIATILNSTEPLFVIPLAALLIKEKISPQAIIGSCIATLGIILIFL